MGKATTILLILIIVGFSIYYFAPEDMFSKTATETSPTEKVTPAPKTSLKTDRVVLKYVSRSGSTITGTVFIEGNRYGELQNGKIEIPFSAIPVKPQEDPFLKPKIKIELKGLSGGNPIHITSLFLREELLVSEVKVEGP